MNSCDRRPKPGDQVILTAIPPGLLEGLPREDQLAISNVVGKSVILNNYDDEGRAEVHFEDAHGVIHFIYVDASVIRPFGWTT